MFPAFVRHGRSRKEIQAALGSIPMEVLYLVVFWIENQRHHLVPQEKFVAVCPRPCYTCSAKENLCWVGLMNNE